MLFCMIIIASRAYLRKAEHACGMTKERHILINLQQVQDETLLNIKQFKDALEGLRQFFN